MTVAEEVAKILLDVKAITFNPKKPYKYTSGLLSPVYTDCRLLISFPKERKIIRDYYVQAVENLGKKVDMIAATATAGIPHGAWVAEAMNLPMVYVRSAAKAHGKGNQIEGIAKKGDHAVVIEDHISTAKSSGETALALKAAGVHVTYVISITTYGMKSAEETFKSNQLTSISLTTFKDVVAMAVKLKYIKPDEKKAVLDWVKDPPSWGRKMGYK